MNFGKIFPWLVVGFMALVFVWFMLPPSYDDRTDYDMAAFAKVPIMHNGRFKPIDTVARTYMMIISGKQTFTDYKGNNQPAVKWFLDAMVSKPSGLGLEAPAARHKVFRITNEEVLGLLGLSPRPRFRYSLQEMSKKIDNFIPLAHRAQEIPPKDRNLYEGSLVELGNHLELFIKLSGWQDPRAIPGLEAGEDWITFGEAVRELQGEGPKNWATESWLDILASYLKEDKRGFNKAVAEYTKEMQGHYAIEVGSASFETFYNQFGCLHVAMYLYLLAFCLACLSWLGWSEPFRQAAWYSSILIFAVHTFGLLARMYIQGRPPVTNLYSSAVFIGWAAVLVALFLEWIFHNSIPTAAGALIGCVTLKIADALSESGDTMEMLQAVLDTNFWLSTHVTAITVGYTATFLAGILGLAYVILGLLTPVLRGDGGKALSKMIYGVICFAMFFSFLGTVLGGIWADQSWGRFWGWDPKENGALLIVIWNALILHARWAGLVKTRGMAILAIFGNNVTAWSWFGTNMLGVGLHSYGFMAGAYTALLISFFGHCAVMGLGMIPLNYWSSFRPESVADPKRFETA